MKKPILLLFLLTAIASAQIQQFSMSSVKWFGAKGDGITDDTAAFQAALDHAKAVRGVVRVPDGIYSVGSLDLTSASDVTIEGDSKLSALYGFENDYPVLDCLGSTRITIRHLGIYAKPGYSPSCGLLLGRKAGDASAGDHSFYRLTVAGKYSVASVYSMSSELNQWDHCSFSDDWADNAVTTMCIAKDNTYHPTMSSKFQTFGAGLGGNGMHIFNNSSFTTAGTNRSSVCVELDQTYGVTLNSCYFTSSAGTNMVLLRRGILGMTINSAGMEQFPTPFPFTFTTNLLTYSSSGTHTQTVALGSLLHYQKGSADDLGMDYGVGVDNRDEFYPVAYVTNMIFYGTPNATITARAYYYVSIPISFMRFLAGSDNYRSIIINSSGLLPIVADDSSQIVGMNVVCPRYAGESDVTFYDLYSILDSHIESNNDSTGADGYRYATRPKVYVRNLAQNVSFVGWGTNLFLPSGTQNQEWGVLGLDRQHNIRYDGGSPVTSGTNQPYSLRVWSGHGQVNALDFGLEVGSPFAGWIQVAQANNLAGAYPLKLQPSGGSVFIGKTNGTEKLVVGGKVQADSGYISGSSSGITVTNDVIVAGNTTNRVVYVGGIIVSNIPNFY